jgi:hypothetical protein
MCPAIPLPFPLAIISHAVWLYYLSLLTIPFVPDLIHWQLGNVRDRMDTTPGCFSVALGSFGSSPVCSGRES